MTDEQKKLKMQNLARESQKCVEDQIRVDEQIFGSSPFYKVRELFQLILEDVKEPEFRKLSTEEKDEIMEETLRLIEQVYSYSASGSNCHIVIDDENIENDNIQWCLDVALVENVHEATQEQLAIERKLLTNFLRLPTQSRKTLLLKANSC